MPDQETYPHAPIIEAVLDIRTRLSAPFSEKLLKKICDLEIEAYPTFRRPFQVQFKVERADPSAEPTSEISSVAHGGAMISKDGRQVFQARPDGFSHNRLAPYIDWATFRTEARRLWAVYRDAAKPESIEFLGLNYNNLFKIPSGVEIGDYLNAYIQIPKEIPQTLEIHNFQAQVVDPATDARISIITSFGLLDAEKMVPVTLNVQAFKFLNKPSADLDEEEIWLVFEALRDLKNLAFESCISDKVRESFR